MTILKLSYCSIEIVHRFAFRRLKRTLVKLYMGHNRIRNLNGSFRLFKSLQVLDLSFNDLEVFDKNELEKLKLDCNRKKLFQFSFNVLIYSLSLRNVSETLQKGIRITHMTGLEELDLSFNNLENLDFLFELQNLKKLSLKNVSSLESFYFDYLKQDNFLRLRELDLRDMSLSFKPLSSTTTAISFRLVVCFGI